jgi:2-polyprenyl-6-hydroxyphenyl methylase/3-demethylubiquinone-9 3-methyltransferase
MSLLRRFIALNQRLSLSIEPILPAEFTRHLHTTYKREAAEVINQRRGQTVVDVGGGRECPFLPFVAHPEDHLFISTDISESELRYNHEVRNRLVADASTGQMPFADQSIDLIASRSVVEHLPNVENFIGECARLLKPGGCAIHTFPSKYSPFSILNQIIPNRMARKILYVLQPQWEEVCGFKAYYDRIYYSSVVSMLQRHDLEIVRIDIRYYQAIYYSFFAPFYFIMLAYDLMLYALGARNLACQLLLVARKRAPEGNRGTG